jgi:uncharacterized protein Veg
MEFKYVKRRKNNGEDTCIVTIKDANGRLITDSIETVDSLNAYYSSIFICERRISQIQYVNSYKPFAIST